MFDTLTDPLAVAGVGDVAAIGGLDPAALVSVVAASHQVESTLVARRLAAVAALLRFRVAEAERAESSHDYADLDGYERAAAEVAAVMNLSPMAAGYLVSHAEALTTRLPNVAALLARGDTDWRTVRLIISRTELVTDPEVMGKLDAGLAARIGNWHSWSQQRIVNAVDAAVRVADPDAARERRVAAEEDRYIGMSALDNGMAEIYGTVAAAAASEFDRRLSELAKQVCPDDPRTLAHRRADALAALTEGRRLTCQCGNPECPSKIEAGAVEQAAGGAQVVVTVIAGKDTLTGADSRPAYLEGYGVIDAEQVRELAAAGLVRFADAAASPAAASRYQPSAALERFVRCRDLTCRFPGCSRRATYCDLDHTIPFNHQNPRAGGLTVASNLKCLCRQHHRLKTFGGWRDQQLADGTVIWTAPNGQTYRTAPAGVDLFPELGTSPCAPPPPNRRSRSKQRSARIAAARNHNREQRPINEERRRVEQARKDEIAARKFRNHMRDMLFLFKGKPSTSPLCTWINDPHESEELPPDWQPKKPKPLPDEPPF